MKSQYLLGLGLVSLLMVSSVKEASSKQLPTNFVSENANTPILLSKMQSVDNFAKSSSTTTIKSGSFVSGEHTTQGTVNIVTQNGKSFIELEQSFKTSSSGPDLVVVLHRSPNVIASTRPPAYPLKRGDYIVIAPLQKFRGSQRYLIPQNVNLADYQSVAIWCRKFNATFGSATVKS
ncbi:electron transfer protein with DM13 domain protein [Nostoc sp. CENA543]|uniref:DM13 domain-containing protein n=1 Tax=Nostoc sp. CENA543 TaxID=1869241 RepID=UPI000CA25ED8|nr:DM13 domain-containing protein [Nostoc sp. CENA543]AUT03149.1 electron transfer protein with DM13 domain protein [Nostoc sp. CENA543]